VNSLVKFAVVSIGGLALGLISAQQIIDGYGSFFTKQSGPWTSWPSAGTRSSNPYVRAHFLTHDRLPVSQFETTEFETTTDSNGRTLDANCTYEITGPMPKTRWWSLYSYASDSRDRNIARTSTNSQQVLTDADGKFRIYMSLDPQTGNWIVPAGESDLVIVLRHYNPVQSITNQFSFEGLPGIIRKDCQ
jgi:hypothetical protein